MAQKTGYEILEKGRVYCATVTSITPNRRHFPRDGAKTYVNDIYFEDEYGKKYVGEYLTPLEKQDGFIVGEIQCFRCDYSNEKGDEITPYPISEGALQNGSILKKFVSDANRNFSIENTTYGLAIVCAKDILIADLNNNPLTEINVDFQDKLFELADAIDIWIQAKRDM